MTLRERAIRLGYGDTLARLDRALARAAKEGDAGLWRRLYALTGGEPFLVRDLAAQIKRDFQLLVSLIYIGDIAAGNPRALAYWLSRVKPPAGFELLYTRAKEYGPGLWKIVESVADIA